MNQARKDVARPSAASAPRILIVEDESDLALLLSYNLEAEGYVVESVTRGDEAALRLAENSPDLVILDWMLPGVSGLEICRRLAGARGDPHLAHHHGDGARRGSRAGARSLGRRRRLCRQAVLRAGTDGAGAGAASDAAGPSASPNASMPETSTWIGRRGAFGAARATSTSVRPSSGCSNTSWKSRAGCSRARNCSTASGGRRRRSTSARWTFTSGDCARRCRAGGNGIRSAPCAAPATPSTKPSANRKRLARVTRAPRRRRERARRAFSPERGSAHAIAFAPAILDRLIGEPAMVGAIGTGRGGRTAVAELGAGRIAKRPTAHRLLQFDDRNPERHRHDDALEHLRLSLGKRLRGDRERGCAPRDPRGRRGQAPAPRRAARLAAAPAGGDARRPTFGDLARPAKPRRWTFPIIALRVRPSPSKLAIWLALLPSIQCCFSRSTFSSVQDIVASFVSPLFGGKRSTRTQNQAPSPDGSPSGVNADQHSL